MFYNKERPDLAIFEARHCTNNLTEMIYIDLSIIIFLCNQSLALFLAAPIIWQCQNKRTKTLEINLRKICMKI